LQIKDL